MSYEINFKQEHNYLHATVTGQNSEQAVNRYLEQVMREALVNKVRRLLIEERLEGPRLDTTSVFGIAAEGSVKYRAVAWQKIAYVDIYVEDSSMKNVEAVASNRGMPLRIFSTVAEAAQWLQEPD